MSESSAKFPRVSVLILNWNGRNWLERFLPSVTATTYPAADIIVVDNGSTDDSVAWTQTHYPGVRVIELPENYGFAEGNNRALPLIDTPYYVLLNSDVEVEAGWLEPLVEAMEADNRLAGVQPKIRAYNQRDAFEYAGAAGGLIDAFGYPFCRGRIFDEIEKDTGQYDTPLDIFWATGACLLVRRAVSDEIGLFDGSFFAHMEEIDFCWRAQNMNYRFRCIPRSVVYHVGGGTLPQGNPRKTFLNVRNSLIMLYKNLPTEQIFYRISVRLLLDGVWAVRQLLGGDTKTVGAIFRAHWAFFRKIRQLGLQRDELYGLQSLEIPRTGWFKKSIVWQHFVKGKKKFSELPYRQENDRTPISPPETNRQ